MYYDKDGSPMELFDWAAKFEDQIYKRVAETTLSNGTWVSTVWLGTDHSLGNGPPLIFETMVFPTRNNLDEQDVARYSTMKEANAGHRQMIETWEPKGQHAKP